MEMKNKLYCHHKSKISLVMKRFSLTCLGVITVVLTITIPTYISTSENQKVVTEARESDEQKEVEEVNDNEEENNNLNEDYNLLAYE